MPKPGETLNYLLSELESMTEEEVADNFSAELLREMIPTMLSAGLLTPDELQTFLFAKNVKLMGGINAYVDSFLDQVLPRMRTMARAERQATKSGTIVMLNRMKTYGGIDADHVKRVEEALEELQTMTGGRRDRKTRKTRKSKRRANKKTLRSRK
jgi:hypothetical protein